MEETSSKVVAGGPREAVDCGGGWARLQLASKAAAGGPGGPTFTHRSTGRNKGGVRQTTQLQGSSAER